MSFGEFRLEQPLWLLSALPALAAAAYSAAAGPRRQAALGYPGAAALAQVQARAGRALVRWAPPALKLAALLLAAGALARPQRVAREAAGPTQGIDILLAIDTSMSMRALDFNPLDRMAAAKEAAREFIQNRVSDRIGIVVFGGAPLLSCPLTLDYEALTSFLDGIEAGMTRSDGTAIGDGLASAVGHLKESAAPSKVVILLTDGRSNTGLAPPPTAAKAARTYGIKVYTVGTGRRGQALYPMDHPVLGRQLVPIPDELDEDALLQIAAETGGRYFRAENRAELASIYREIDRLEKHEFEKPEIVSYQDLHPWLLLPASLLLAAELLLSQTLLLKLP